MPSRRIELPLMLEGHFRGEKKRAGRGKGLGAGLIFQQIHPSPPSPEREDRVEKDVADR